MSVEDFHYYSARFNQELDAANDAVNPVSAEIHRTLAKLYSAKATELNLIVEEDRRSAIPVGDGDNFRQILQSGPA